MSMLRLNSVVWHCIDTWGLVWWVHHVCHHQVLVLEQAEVEVVAVVKADFWMM